MSETERAAEAEPREVELKLTCAGADLTALAAHPRLQGAAMTEPEHLVSTYYDTPNRDLRAADLTLRVRAKDGRYIQTVKAGAGGVGLFDRAEWETEIAGETPEPAAWAGTAAEAVLKAVDTPVETLFSTIVRRREIPVLQADSRILVTLDEGRVESPAGDAPICEIELELQEGNPAELFQLAQALAETVPLRLSVHAKSAVGFGLIDGTGRNIVKAEPIDLPADATVGEVFRRVARACLRHLRLNETVFLEGGQPPEALHQIRVSLRRLRSALSLFAPMLAGDPRAAGFNDEIKRVTEPFGHARNLDVFLGHTLPDLIKARPEEAGLVGLRERAETARERAYDVVLTTLQSPQWRSLIIDFAGWIETGAWNAQPAAAERGQDFAARVLDKARGRLKKRGRGLKHLNPHTRHRARIAAKKLRYGAEFFASLYHKKKAQRRQGKFGDVLSDLQDHLGALNDLETARSMSEGLSGPPMPGSDDPGARDLLKAAAEARADLLDVKPFWR
ncbi:Inorganic triphosphatase YgiF, contains CYTH and CHAD domains [Methylobacterium phyllostachyos]|uniref:Inorganic triphosphatase YgiF, contains CYTH and CHAD domains n=1 Tax=Methylobacterium phyllostachyos TaxID=582672 RepID=A0A1G9WLK8_9HYPH|nr:CYTH and CHAD domain-containing protein [Methylobacterium phyllostachyos]SDM84915.1 Inorganic triphosphatase YgiF, contains CYTH and CHAD domains [Methylobacterium phyllostachyos]